MPVLILAFLCLRAGELASGIRPGAKFPDIARIAAAAAGMDLLSLARFLPVIFLFSLPFLLLRSRRAGFWTLGIFWSLLAFLQAALIQYFLTARVPLGSDLFAYSWAEISTTASGSIGLSAPLAAGLALALVCLWSLLALLSKRARPLFSGAAAAGVLAAAVLALFVAPARLGGGAFANEDDYDLALNKSEFFSDSSFAYLSPLHGNQAAPRGAASSWAAANPEFRYLDPKYPFLRAEQTPDVLGKYFNVNKSAPPNLVFIIAEGLGRDFSGPGASLGSFTPRLDQLADKSLYFENFLSNQGRTFAVLPTIFGSMPFGTNGICELGERMPPDITLLNLLKAQGYGLKFYTAFNLDFDNERIFLHHQGMDDLVDETNFGAGYKISNDWGYDDGDLVARALAGEAEDVKQPFISVIQTITTHTPYTFSGQAAYNAVFERRLDQLGIPAGGKASYRAHRDIYTSILYTDDMLGRFFTEIKKNPAYQNTIFIVTGDHRLPELPMGTRICRYHVPLIIFSPLLKAPARIRSVSSQLDLAPSLLAFLADNYRIKTPRAVTWLGSGLDMEPSFRNLHTLPLKQTKTDLVDFISGSWFLNQNTLYKISDGMAIEQSGDKDALKLLQGKFAAFRAANDQFARTLTLMPGKTADKLAPYRAEDRATPAARAGTGAAGLNVREVLSPESAKAGKLSIEIAFSNPGPTLSDPFVPLVVLMTNGAKELSETYGPPQQLPAGTDISVKMDINSDNVKPGRYFMAVIPSNPDTGKSIGEGRYRIPVQIKK